MYSRIRYCILITALLVFTLKDTSGQDGRVLGRRGDYLTNAGNIAAGLAVFQMAYRAAQSASDAAGQRRLLNNIGACNLALFRYKDAARTLLFARESGIAAEDWAMVGGADVNLSSLYAQMDDLSAAEQYGRDGLAAYRRAGASEQRPRALINLANILARTRLTAEAEGFFVQGIDEATRLDQAMVQTLGWLRYGNQLWKAGRLQDADSALQKSWTLCTTRHVPMGDAVLWNQCRLRLLQNDPAAALRLIDAEMVMAHKCGGLIPPWRLHQTRAEILLALDKVDDALAEAREALRLARIVRANLIPDDESRVGAEGYLDKAYSTLIDAGNRTYLKTGDARVLRETFEAAEENRAQSLQALLPGSSDWRKHLPPAYWDKMAELIAQQRKVLTVNSPQTIARAAQLHTELSQMEAQAGAASTPGNSVLQRVLRNLPRESSLLSFRLGERASWLWAISPGTLRLYQLPPRARIASEIEQFQAAISDNDRTGIGMLGQRLYRDLFAKSGQPFQQTSRWYVSLDRELHGLSLPALVVENRANGPVYLTERKSLQVIPGAQLFDAPISGKLSKGVLLAAGDAVYNPADPRFEKFSLERHVAWSLPRLPGSGDEVRFAAGLWPRHAMLTGPQLNKRELLRAMERDPDIVHIASHVIEGEDRWHSGILALGLTASGEPDLLAPEEIVLHPIHCRLVVMTGCSSGSGTPLSASGLMGLTRAWLGAGAGAVLATRWPTLDESSAGLIGHFYRKLLLSPDGDIPGALRQARIELLAHGGWRAEPRYWASYFLIGNR